MSEFISGLSASSRRPVAADRFGEVSFTYLPNNPLVNGWRLARQEAPLINYWTPLDRPGALEILTHDAIDYEVAKSLRVCNHVRFAMRSKDNSYAYVKVQIVTTDGKRPLDFVWIACDLGDKPIRRVSSREWVIYRAPQKSGWAEFDLSLFEEVSRTFGTEGRVEFGELLGFRLRGEVAISPIQLFRVGAPDVAHDSTQSEEPDSQSPRQWSRDQKIGVGAVAIAIVGVAVAISVPEIRRLVKLDPPPAETKQPMTSPGVSGVQPRRVTAEFAPDIQQLRSRNEVVRIPPSESDKSFAEVPAKTFGFVLSGIIPGSSVQKLSLINIQLPNTFEVQKISDGTGLIVGYVGSETSDHLREGMPAGISLALYSAAWKDAHELVAIPFSNLRCTRSREIAPDDKASPLDTIEVLDCVTQ